MNWWFMVTSGSLRVLGPWSSGPLFIPTLLQTALYLNQLKYNIPMVAQQRKLVCIVWLGYVNLISCFMGQPIHLFHGIKIKINWLKYHYKLCKIDQCYCNTFNYCLPANISQNICYGCQRVMLHPDHHTQLFSFCLDLCKYSYICVNLLTLYCQIKLNWPQLATFLQTLSHV